MIMNNKRGWIKILEASIAVLLVAGVLIVVANKGYLERDDISQKVYSSQIAILKEIQNNNSLRDLITNESLFVPLRWKDFESSGLYELKAKIISRTPEYLICEASICSPDDSCDYIGGAKNIYANAIIISASREDYVARQIKLFCWTQDEI